jgi:cyclopropane-fatty-acyl-phospholipid synthase
VHYDLSNDFFEAMLDPNMQYSCALFAEGDDLASAQLRKLDWICERLRLRPGLRLLDIGCGWGGLARHAARHFGCQVVGITVSREQFQYAQRWCRGLDVEIQLRDYREVTEQFDRVVSVGTIEHVGYRNYRTYMRAAARSLGEDGLFLCQGICGNVSRVHTDPWIERYIFANSMLPSVAQLTRAAEGVFIVEDVKNIGPNYDPTLLAWEENFRRAWPRFADRYGERFRRMWRFYLLSCAGAFRARSLEVYSILFSKEATDNESVPRVLHRARQLSGRLNLFEHSVMERQKQELRRRIAARRFNLAHSRPLEQNVECSKFVIRFPGNRPEH